MSIKGSTIKKAGRGHPITFTIDGREVAANDGDLLIDAAKKGDVEIPYFCYEKKLGAPVGACRMCLVEIEGMPKLQTACSTPVKDGMVVATTAEEVKQAQESVVEFLLVNHPLDCPVCDKGGECPLQDIAMGWGPGSSRMQEPKRHFVKPIELSSKIAIDRERCILCYRCVRFSQEVSEDNQLVLLERGADSFVGTHDESSYEAPFSGNVIELCPVGALTSTEYRFRARPWDIENSASICTLCPSQCNIHFTVRNERVERVIARDNEAVDDGWLCDRGRFSYPSIYSEQRIIQPLVRSSGLLRPASWEKALNAAASILKDAGSRSAAVVGGQSTNEEGFLLQGILRKALGSNSIDCRQGAALDPELVELLNEPKLQASVVDLDKAETILVVDADPVKEMPIIDLRIRKAVRRGRAKLAVIGSEKTALEAGAVESVRHQPQKTEATLAALTKALIVRAEEESELHGHGGIKELKHFYTDQSVESLAGRAGADPARIRELAKLLCESGTTVIVWGERCSFNQRSNHTLRNLVNLALLLKLDQEPHGGLFELPSGTNSRGLREVGCLPNFGPGLTPLEAGGLSADEIALAAQEDDLGALYLLHSDPLAQGYGADWGAALQKTKLIAHGELLTDGIAASADVVFPQESYAEKQGTVTHADGRLQRIRSAVPRPQEVRMEWQVLADLAQILGWDSGIETLPMAFSAVSEAVSFYNGLTLEAITAEGVRWQDTSSGNGARSEFEFFRAEEPMVSEVG